MFVNYETLKVLHEARVRHLSDAQESSRWIRLERRHPMRSLRLMHLATQVLPLLLTTRP